MSKTISNTLPFVNSTKSPSMSDKKTKVFEEFYALIDSQKNSEKEALAAVATAAKFAAFDADDEHGSDQVTNAMFNLTSAQRDTITSKLTLKNAEIIYDAHNNQTYDLSLAIGQEIFYQGDVRHYNGKESIDFQFNLIAPNPIEEGSLSANISIYNNEGNLVRTDYIHPKFGDNKYIWKGDDNNRETVEPGEYSIKIEAYINSQVEDKHHVEKIACETKLSGVATELIINEGAIDKIKLNNGKIIEKDQVIGVRHLQKTQDTIQFSPDLIGKEAEFDLSKINIENGKATLYYNNHLANATAIAVKIGAAEFEINNPASGFGKIQLDQQLTAVKDGAYQASLSAIVAGEHVPLASKISTAKIVGVDLINKTLALVEGRSIDAHCLAFVGLDNSSIFANAEKYHNKSVTYTDNIALFQDGKLQEELTLPLMSENKLLLSSEAHIYDEKQNLVKTIGLQFDHFKYLNKESQNLVNVEMAKEENTHLPTLVTSLLMEGKIQFADDYLGNVTIPISWDGIYDQPYGKYANSGQVFHVNYHNQFLIDKNMVIEIDRSEKSGIIENVDIELGEIESFILDNGKKISASQISTIGD